MKKTLYLICLAASLILSSCVSREKLLYLQDMDVDKEYPITQKYEPVIQRDDELSIIVSSKDPELAMAFNIPGTGSYTVNKDGSVTNAGNQGSEKEVGYVVDSNGDIDFPVLGKLHVEGMTRDQLINYIKDQLRSKGLINEPIVRVSFLNFKFTVLGEVGSVGMFEFKGDRLTLLEAIAMAGDLKSTSRIDRIKIIRDYGNKRRVMYADLRTVDLYNSPAFYLHQNDVIFVEPNSMKAAEQSQRMYSYWTTGISAVTTLVTLILYFTRK